MTELELLQSIADSQEHIISLLDYLIMIQRYIASMGILTILFLILRGLYRWVEGFTN